MSHHRISTTKFPGNSNRKGSAVRRDKTKVKKTSSKSQLKPVWNDSISDLTAYKSSPVELIHRNELHRSKNSEAARLELIDKRFNNKKKAPDLKNDLSFHSNELQNVLDRSDLMLNSARELFNHQSRFVGFPSITAAPSVDRDNSDSRDVSPKPKNSVVEFMIQPKFINADNVYDDRNRSVVKFRREDGVKNSFRAKENDSDDQSTNNVRGFDDMQKVLLQLRGNVAKNEKRYFSPSEKQLRSDRRLSSNCDTNTLSGFTSCLLDTLTTLSNQYSEVADQLDEERETRKKLAEQLQNQKITIDELTSEILQLQTQQVSLLHLCKHSAMEGVKNNSWQRNKSRLNDGDFPTNTRYDELCIRNIYSDNCRQGNRDENNDGIRVDSETLPNFLLHGGGGGVSQKLNHQSFMTSKTRAFSLSSPQQFDVSSMSFKT